VKTSRYKKKMVERTGRPGPRCRVNLDIHLDEYNKLRAISAIKNESVPRLLVRMAQEWHMKQQMVVLTLPVSVVNDAYYIARHLGFESHEHWISQSITDSVRAASRQFRESGINLRRLLLDKPEEEQNASEGKGSHAGDRSAQRELQEPENAPGENQQGSRQDG
jgi:hypothetical protein